MSALCQLCAPAAIHRALTCILISLAMSGQALRAQEATGDMQARAWAYSCATCHGVAASPVTGIPSLAGIPAKRLVEMMQTYASANRPGVLMSQIARGYDEATVWRIGNWYESLVPDDAKNPPHSETQP